MNNSLAAWVVLFGVGLAAMVVLMYVALKSMVAFRSVVSTDKRPVQKIPVVVAPDPCNCDASRARVAAMEKEAKKNAEQ